MSETFRRGHEGNLSLRTSQSAGAGTSTGPHRGISHRQARAIAEQWFTGIRNGVAVGSAHRLTLATCSVTSDGVFVSTGSRIR
jgi:hypothetical protein